MSEPLSSWRVAEASVHWRAASGDLPDVNVWLALCSAAHPFHAAAMQYWQSACEAGTPLWFCRSTMMGLVSLEREFEQFDLESCLVLEGAGSGVD